MSRADRPSHQLSVTRKSLSDVCRCGSVLPEACYANVILAKKDNDDSV